MEWVGRSATEVASAVRASEITAAGVVEEHLDHLAELDERLGAFVTVRRDAALREAEAVDARDDRFALPLAGVPVAVPDVVDVSGEATRAGSRATAETPAHRDDPVVKRLRAAGAVVVGKTRVPELGIWGTSEDEDGTAVSPWDPTRSAGGAAGGSGAAVGAGIVPIALAIDGFGAARVSGAACGVLGMRPGGDLAAFELGGAPHAFGMSRYGPIATTVADLSLALDVVAGTEHLRAATLPDAALNVAVSWKAASPGVVVTSSWREAAIEAGRLLNHAGHTVAHVDPPYERQTTQAAIARWTQAARADVETLELDVEALQPRTRAHVGAGERLAKLSPVRDEDATRWRERLEPFFEDHDVLITPAFARIQPAASAWHTKPWAANIAANLSAYPFFPAWSLADVPSAVVPLWEDGGRPLAVQVVAGPGRDDLVLAVAARLEALVPWTRHAPGWGVGD